MILGKKSFEPCLQTVVPEFCLFRMLGAAPHSTPKLIPVNPPSVDEKCPLVRHHHTLRPSSRGAARGTLG